MLQHFRGNLYSWDPLLVYGLARHREVVLVTTAGLWLDRRRSRERHRYGPPCYRLHLCARLGADRPPLVLARGHVAQELSFAPAAGSTLVLAGTAPQGGPICTAVPTRSIARTPMSPPRLPALLFFSPSSKAAPRLESIQRLYSREATAISRLPCDALRAAGGYHGLGHPDASSSTAWPGSPTTFVANRTTTR